MSYSRPTFNPDAPKTASLLPLACYRVLANKVDLTPSKNTGAPMISVDVQVLSPEVVKAKDGSESQTVGVEGTMRIVFTDKNLKNAVEALVKLGVPLPPAASTQDEDIAQMQQAAAQFLDGGKTFEIVASSKREPMMGADGPLKDSAGREIQGAERPDFNSFNIVGNAKQLSEVGGGTPY